jgi:hypothetical protein
MHEIVAQDTVQRRFVAMELAHRAAPNLSRDDALWRC